MSTKGNQSAFPWLIGRGLTKREVFIAAALQGLCANPKVYNADTSYGDLVYQAVKVADWLLLELTDDPL